MKKMIILYILLSIISTSKVFAQAHVSFVVDMREAENFDPLLHEVYISGANENGNSPLQEGLNIWPIPGSEPALKLTQTDQEGFYALNLTNVAPDTYMYKYFFVPEGQQSWDFGEWGGNPNRIFQLGTDDVEQTDVWGDLVANAEIHLFINEIMASNASIIEDEDGDTEDWIEVYNHSIVPVQLEGYGLSDTQDQPFRWTFPNVTINPFEYMLIWASGKDRREPEQPLHTNFSISSAGEPILLTHPEGELLDYIPEVQHQTNLSYGRFPDIEGELQYMTEPSPGFANQGPAYSMLLQPLEASHIDGYYPEAFNLSLYSPDDNIQIYYTLDGSEPDQDAYPYSEPISIASRIGEPNVYSIIPTNNISESGPPYYEGWQPPLGEVYKINVVRAKAFHNDAPQGITHTFSYIIDPDTHNTYSLPIFSLVSDPGNLFDDDYGIYVHGSSNYPNYFQRGREWERPASLSFFEKNGSLAFKEDLGIRLNGNTTRSRPRKSIRVISRSEYGNSWLNYRLFPNKDTDLFKRFILRNSGNDWDFAIFRDAMIQHLAMGMHVETQYYRPAIVFINGEYWGIHNIRDKYDERYFYGKYGLYEHEITVLENNAQYKYGNPNGKSHYDDLIHFINNQNLQSTTYYAHVKEQIDIQSFIDFQLTHIFPKNTDWPGNNVLFWRYMRDDYVPDQGVQDGRWRWMILDTDFGFDLPFFYVPGIDEGPAHNTLEFATNAYGNDWPNPAWSTLLFRKLLENQDFKNTFILRYSDLLNTRYSSQHVNHVIDSIKNMLLPEMQEHIHRWRRPTSLAEWQNNLQDMKNFADLRTQYQRIHLKEKFGLSESKTLSLNINESGAGYIRVNTIDIKPSTPGISAIPYPWSGKYFDNMQFEIEAFAYPGYEFSHWSGSVSGSTALTILAMNGDMQITAHFERTDEHAPIHYWLFDTSIPNNTPLEYLQAGFSKIGGAELHFISALQGYPFHANHVNWRKASMERRNNPTPINYIPAANDNTAYEDSEIRGLQIKQPFVGDAGENTMIFHLPSTQHENIQFSLAAINEGAAEKLILDYALNEENHWITDESKEFYLSDTYQLFSWDLSNHSGVKNNPHFSIRIRFSGSDMENEEGNRVTFNNISLSGTGLPTDDHTGINKDLEQIRAYIYPNPANTLLNIGSCCNSPSYSIYDLHGKIVLQGVGKQIELTSLPEGFYIIQIRKKTGKLTNHRFMKVNH